MFIDEPSAQELTLRSEATVTYMYIRSSIMLRRARGLSEYNVCERRYLSYEEIEANMVSLQAWIHGEVLSKER